MFPHLGLDALLAALRDAGLRLGVGEVERLRRVFALEPDFSGADARERLKSLLRAVVVKSQEERAVFDKVADAWMERAEAEELPAPDEPWVPGPRRHPRRWLRWLLASALALVVVAAAAYFVARQGEEAIIQEISVPPESPPPLAEEPVSPAPPEVMPPTVPLEVPDTPKSALAKRDFSWLQTPRPVWTGWAPLGLGVISLLTAGGLWGSLRRRRFLPLPAPPPARPGPPRAFLAPPPPPRGPELLDARQQETLVWGIDSFVAEEPTRRLDLAATVRATAAAAGLPRLCFEQARYHREVWLWVDKAADDPMIGQLAIDVETTLVTHGLPVERATFRGLPERLVTADGRVFAPREEDERRDAALVAVLTDGRRLARHYEAGARPVQVDALLRQLSHWPRLAFVDFSGGATELPRLLARHALDVIAPDELAAFLGTSTAPAPGAPLRACGDDRVWAAACALVPSSVDERSALALQRRLGLVTSPWALRLLRAEARSSPGRLDWRQPDRVRLINWLGEAEEGGVTAESTLGRALDFWEERYGAALAAGEQDAPAYQHLVMERALLRLWRRPRQAARELYELYGGVLGEKIRHHLSGMSPRDWKDDDRIRLPWPWHELPADARVMLRAMGLGGGMPAETLRRPGRLWLGVGLSAGLAAGAFGVAATRPTAECGAVARTDPMTQIMFVRICPGTLLIGSPESEAGRWEDDGPVHPVSLSEFWIGRYKVTNEEHGIQEAKALCERFGYQLPTKAQWEFLRSAYRVRVQPGDFIIEVDFRCVLVPRRQP